MKLHSIQLVLLLVVTAALSSGCQSAPADGATPTVENDSYTDFSGTTLTRPEGYRKWVFVGEPVTPNDMNGGKAPFPEFHSVYMDPESFEHYERTGVYRDGTILVKELASVGTKEASSGKGYFMGDFIGLEATVKDSTLFPDEPGNWAYFSFTDPNGGPVKASAEPFPTASCNSCHEGNAAEDFVFSQHYPVLRAAKGRGVAAVNDTPFEIDGAGSLARPEGYRKWVFVGEPVTPNDMNGGKAPFPEFHSVYMDPDSFDHFDSTGEYRDGTILVKELVSVGSKEASSGKGYFMGEFIGLEATIKSSKHFPDEPGNWAYFSFTDPNGGAPAASAEPFPTASCNSCHEGNAEKDFVFSQYYPVLKRTSNVAAMSPPADDQWQGTAPTPGGSTSGVPLDTAQLFDYLAAKRYDSFAAKEGAAHPGRGPHTEVTAPVRVYYNEVLANSLSAGAEEHPSGAVAVKEMFTKEGELRGWAVMAKTDDETDDGRGWFWYETTSSSEPEIAAAGNGVPGCVSCHSFRDQDLVLSGFPLR